MNENIIMTAENYDRIDGRNAYQSDIKRLTIGTPANEENKGMRIALQIWRENSGGVLEIDCEIPVHQVIDLMIFLGSTFLHFSEAYRFPLLYDPEKPVIDKIPIQGDGMSVSICTDNPNIDEDIQKFSQDLSDIGEITGERLRLLRRMLNDLGY